jgi:hypothetical protein
MQRSHRRWFQFSLRTLLVALTGVAIWLGVQFNRPRITAENLDQLEVVATMPIDVWEIQWSRDGGRVAFLTWGKPAEIREAKTLFRVGALGVGKAPIHVFGGLADGEEGSAFDGLGGFFRRVLMR